MSTSLQTTGEQITAYMAKHWQTPCTLDQIEQIPGGASRETYLVRLNRNGASEGIVVRRDPPSSLIDTDRALEYHTYVAIHRSGIMPVPEPIVLEESPGELAYPFSVTALVEQGQASPAGLDEPHMQDVLATIAQQKWTMLGKLAAANWQSLALPDFMQAPQHAAAHELAYWQNVIANDSLHPQPIAQAALRWLQRNLPPPSEQHCLVHGDYRTGNFLYTAAGEITAVLDWEMAHIGDPLEDLAWSLDPLWAPDPHLAGRLLPREEAISVWERASGLTVDREAFRWWQVFASVKALAIWISSAEDYVNGTSKNPILAFAGWPLIDRQNRIILDRLAPDSAHKYAEPLA